MKTKIGLIIGLILALVTQGLAQKPGSYSALDFGGNGDNVSVRNHTSLNPTSAITIEAWIKPDNFGTNVYDNTIVDKHDWISGNAGYVLRCGDGGKLSWNFASRTSGSWVETISGTVLSTGTWYHVVGTFDGDTARIYVNGVLQNSTAHSSLINTSTSPIAIGAGTFAKGRDFDGSIDEVRIWQTALSETTIRDWMCKKVTSKHPQSSNLVALWDMNENTGSTIRDGSSNSNAGTLSSTKLWVNSGAAIGDSVLYTYSSNPLSYTSNLGDKITVNNYSGSPVSTHLYIINQKSQLDMGSNYYALLDSNMYFGVFQAGGSSPSFDLSYSYKGNPSVNGNKDCGFDLLVKGNGNADPWKSTNTPPIYASDSFHLSKQSNSEYSAAIYPTDSNLYVKSSNGKLWFCEGESIRLIAAGNDSFTYKWYRNNKLLSSKTSWLSIDSGGTYYAEASRNGTSCTFKSKNITITSQAKPNVKLTNLKGACEDLDSIILRGGTPKGGVYSGISIKNDSIFSPSRVGAGKYNIIYSYTDASTTCSSSDTAVQEVFSLPKLGLTKIAELCDNEDSLIMNHATPTGGTYSGPGISNNSFFPDSLSIKAPKYPFTYSYTDSNGCGSTISDSIELKVAPNTFLLPIPKSCLNDAPFDLKGSPNLGKFTGSGITGKEFNPAAAGSGLHRIIYSFTASNNCSASDTQWAQVHKNTAVTWNQNISSCINGDSIELIEGTPKGGTFTGAGVKQNYFYPELSTVGKVYLDYVFIDSNGCRNAQTVEANVLDTTAISEQNKMDMCPSTDSVLLDFAKPSGGNYQHSAVTNNYYFSEKNTPGTSNITYAYTNTDGCQSLYTTTITQVQVDSVAMSLPSSACEGDDPIRIQVHPSGGSLVGTGVIGDFFSPKFSGTGTFPISYTVTETHQCEVTVTDTIVVAEIPEMSLAAIPSVCSNQDSFELKGGLPAGGNYLLNGTASRYFYPQSAAFGKHEVEYHYANTYGCENSAVVSFHNNPSPSKPRITNKDGVLEATGFNGHQWYDEQGEIDGATGRTYEPTKTGKYSVVITSDSMCTSRSDPYEFEFISVNNPEKYGLSVYPTPATKQIYIRGLNKAVNYTIYDLLGRNIQSGTSSGDIDLHKLEHGTYLLNVEHFDGQTISFRIIKAAHGD